MSRIGLWGLLVTITVSNPILIIKGPILALLLRNQFLLASLTTTVAVYVEHNDSHDDTTKYRAAATTTTTATANATATPTVRAAATATSGGRAARTRARVRATEAAAAYNPYCHCSCMTNHLHHDCIYSSCSSYVLFRTPADQRCHRFRVVETPLTPAVPLHKQTNISLLIIYTLHPRLGLEFFLY